MSTVYSNGKPTVVDGAEPLHAGDRGAYNDTATLGLLSHVVDAERCGVDHTLQVDVQGQGCRLFQPSLLVDLGREVVRPGRDASVSIDVVDAPVDLLRSLEESQQVAPLRHVRLDERERRGAHHHRLYGG